MTNIRIGIVGYGKIAQDQHAPAIAANPEFTFVAAVTKGSASLDVPVYKDVREMLAKGGLDAAAICTPASVRHDIASACLEAGLHVFLEKPPGATLGDVADMAQRAAAARRTLFTSWHAQYNGAVNRAAGIVRAEGLAELSIEWFEDVEKWHPGQQWIWDAGGFGVFDAGINALSIATKLSPTPLIVRHAAFECKAGSDQPIAAQVTLGTADAGPFEARFDWRPRSDEHWVVNVQTKAGRKLSLTQGGARLAVDGSEEVCAGAGEYPSLYGEFARLIAGGTSLVDSEPLRVLSDIFLVASRSPTAIPAGAQNVDPNRSPPMPERRKDPANRIRQRRASNRRPTPA
ncbi:MAG: Gfo/Idh/MocA family oxidoreductase [Sphingomonadaceae bacterium]|nr:Gfo/Idh/MocA family oxidoreductase [Sphingomonadaceae bacterium]